MISKYFNEKSHIKVFLQSYLLLICFITVITAESLVSGNNNPEREEIRSLIVQLKDGSNKEADVEILKKGKSAVPILIELLNDNPVAIDAVSILGMFGPDALEAIPSLMVYKKNFENRNRPPFMDHSRSSWFIDVALMKIGVHTKAAVPYLVKALDVNDYMVRLYATLALKEIGPDAVDAVPALVKLIKNSCDRNDEGTRDIAAEVIIAIGPDAKDAVPVLIEALNTPNTRDEGRKVSEALVSIGVPAVPILRNALVYEDNPEVIWGIAWVLGKIGPEAKDATKELVKALENQSFQTRRSAAIALGKIGPPAKLALSNLIQHFTDESDYIRVESAYACYLIDPNMESEVISVIIKELSKSNPPHIAAEILGSLGSKAKPAVPALIKKVEESNGYTQFICVEALGSIGPSAIEAVPVLLEKLNDPDANNLHPTVAISIWQIEHKPRKEIITTLINYISKTYASNNVISTLVEIGEPVIPLLIEAVQSNNAKFRINAAKTLNEIGPTAEQAVDSLISMLGQKDNQERIAAAEALGKLGPKAKSAVPILVEMLQDIYTQGTASRALANLAPSENEKAMPIFISTLKESNSRARRDAINALAGIGPKAAEAVPSIEKLLYDSDAEVRKSASQALEQIRKQ